MTPRRPTTMDHWAVRRPVVSTLTVGASWGFAVAILMSIANAFTSIETDSFVFTVIFFTVFGAISFGPWWRRSAVRRVRYWEKANAVSSSV